MGEIRNGDYISQYSGDEIDKLLTTTVWQSNENLLDNWDFSSADNIVDQRGGKVVPPGTPWWTSADNVLSSGTSGSGGTAQAYRQITVTGTNSGGVAYVGWVYNNITYYTRAEYAVRGYVANDNYLIDRWKGAPGAIMRILPNGIGITGADKNVLQVLGVEASTPLIGKKITYSALVDGDLIYKTTTVPQIPTSSTNWFASVSTANFIIVLGIGTSGRLTYVFKNRSTYTGESVVYAVKLELGDTQTLCHNEGTAGTPVWVLNEHQDYGEELQKCQRYYEILPFEEYLQANILKQYVMRTLVEMRTNLTSSNCTLKSLSGTVGKLSVYTGSAWVNADASVQQMDTPNARKSAVRVTRTATSNQYCAGYLIADCNL